MVIRWSQIAAQLPGRTDNEVKNFWNSYIKKKLRERGIDPATHKPLAGKQQQAATTASVFCDAELVPTTATPPLLSEPLLDGGVVKLPLDWTTAGGNALSGYLPQPGCNFDIPPAPVIPSASSSSTLTTSMADGEHGNSSNIAGLPWLELGPNTMDSYAGALDELRWSEYFDGAFQAAASQQGALQGQCVYGGAKDDVAAVQIDVVHGLSNWC